MRISTLVMDVYHKSNTRLKMVVIRKDDENRNLVCRWINKDGNKLEEEFLFAELIKSDDYDIDTGPRIQSIVI